MMQSTVIPAIDPNPLPAPFWVFKLLLLVTFLLHVLAMNALVGGSLLALAHGRRRFASDLKSMLPTLMAATITLGVAPLLFLQVLYGQFFYSSSVVLGWLWFLVIPILIVAYYALYFGKALWASVAGILAVGFIYINNLTFSQTPEAWPARYFASPSGWNLNLSEPSLAPRALHFLVAAIAVGGMLLMVLALLRHDRDMHRAGAVAFLSATAAQFFLGFWFLVALPQDKRMLFMGGDAAATACFALGALGTAGILLAVLDSLRRDRPRLGIYAAAAGTALVIAAMLVMRDRLRDAYLAPYFAPGRFAVATQWSTLPLFLALFLGGVGLWIVMLRRYAQNTARTR